VKKKFKKLSLTTETLRNLSQATLKEVVGADTTETAVTKCTLDCTLCTGNCTECTRVCTLCTRGCNCVP
jgi:hypothetical protein